MLKKTLIVLSLPLFSVLVISVVAPLRGVSAQPASKTAHSVVATGPATGTLQKLIVESGTVTIDLDLNGLTGSASLVARPLTLQFAVGANSFLPILVFNNLLRDTEEGSMTLVPVAGVNAPSYNLPAPLGASLKQLVVEKLSSDKGYDLAVRDGNTGLTFFNVEGGQYDYDANAQSLTIRNGRLLISKEFANALGRPSDAGSILGKISIGAAMQTIQTTELDQNGDIKSETLPALNRPDVGTVPGPDVIVGNLIGLQQLDNGAVNGLVGLSLGTDACNKGTVNVEWIALPDNRHPFIPQNLYRMSGGATNNERFEQIGQSWGKHAFAAASSNSCGFGCNGVGGDHLGSGCSDAYGAGLNGDQDLIGSRAWVNPFTGFYAQNPDPNDHTGHVHDVTSHRILVQTSDLIPAQNPGATYFAEAQYIVPHEGTWCQAHPDQCNMFNNASYQQQSVTGGPTNFNFSPIGNTVREQPAIKAWTGATVSDPIQPVPGPPPGGDGIFFVGYKVTGPNAGIWHYEYALYNQNLDRAIQSFSVPVGPGVNVTNIDFHAPPQHPGFANDGTQGNTGYSSTPWAVDTTNPNFITWDTETFATNQNANAIRFGTLYNFRFDADQAPNPTAATVGFFKTGSPIGVLIQAPGGVPSPSPTPTPTATSTPTPTPTGTPSPTPTATATPTGTATPTATPTPTTSPCGQLTITSSSGEIVPGDTDIGSHCDDCDTALTLPFPVTVLGQTFTSVNVSSNGRLDFVCVNEPGGYVTQCLPASPNVCSYDNTIFPLWQDMRTDIGLSGCANFPGGNCGVFTSVTGSAPNRIFNIEWRTVLFANNDATQNFEVRFYENDPSGRFDVVYGAIDSTGADHNYVGGLQGPDGCVIQDFCTNPAPVQNVVHTYAAQGGPTPTSTPTPTATVPPSPTPTPSDTIPPTATPTATATPTSTPRALPRARPTPHPRPTPP